MRFKILPQISNEDCGAACVCMLLNNYFKKDIPLCEIRPMIKNTQSGTSFSDMKNGMEMIGIESKIYESKKEAQSFSEMKLPCITQIKNVDDEYHYILIFKVSKHYIYYADPAYTTVKRMKYEEFLSIWEPYIIQIDLSHSKVLLSLESNLRDISYTKLLKLIRGRYIIITLLSIMVYALGLFMSTMYNTYFNILIPSKIPRLIISSFWVFIIAAGVKFLLSYLSTIATNSVNKTLDTKLSNEFFKSLFQKPAAALEYFGIGEILATLSNVVTIRQRFVTCVINLPMNFLWLGVSLFLVFKVNIYFSILMTVLIIIFTATALFTNDNYQKYSKDLLKSNKFLNDKIIDIFSNTTMIKSHGQEEVFIKRGQKELVSNIIAQNKLFNFDAKFFGIKQLFLDSFNIAIFSIGALQIADGHLSVGILLTYNSIIGFATNPLITILNYQSILTQGKTAENLLLNFIGTKINMFGHSKFPHAEEENSIRITISDLSFSFSSRNRLFKNVSLDTSSMKNIAIVGSNGSGKTTFGKILCRQYLPDSGQVMINRVPLNEISEKELIDNILFVDSDQSILSTSIIDNILLGRQASVDNVMEVSNAIGLSRFIDQLSNGYETQIGKTGLSLSLGQRQLIKIARGLIEKREIMVFDEITNGLDEEYKDLVFEYLNSIPGIKFFITHDNALANKCEMVINMDDYKGDKIK